MNEHEYWKEQVVWREEQIEVLRAELRLWQERYTALVQKVAEGTALTPAPRIICCADCPTLKRLEAEKLK